MLAWVAVTLLGIGAAGADAARLPAVVETLRSSPARAPGGAPLFPRDLAIAELGTRGESAFVRLDGGWGPYDEVLDELRLETLLGALDAFGIEGGVRVEVRGPEGWRRLGVPPDWRPPPPRTRPEPVVPLPRSGRPAVPGALAGRRIAISAGHGWLQNDSGGWYTQRSRWDFSGCGRCRGILEDFFNAELVSRHLVPLLQGMGAEVVLVRDADLSEAAGRIVDDADGGYDEDGGWAAGANAGGWGGGYRVLAPGAEGSAVFEWTPAGPGAKRVGLRWLAGGNRTPGALAIVTHGGGSTVFDLDQRRMGSFWLDLGSFWFRPGRASLTLVNAGAGYLVADAVRVGGGMHGSGKPWWQMAARTFVPFAGAPVDVTERGDVTIRPAYAEHVGADAFLSFHGNASGASGGATASGTSTYRFSCIRYDDHTASDSATTCDDPPGSKRLADTVHNAMLEHLRAEWDPNWKSRGRLVANFGELRELVDTPGALVESAFFDNLANPAGNPPPRYADNRSMHDPRWREALARGIANGLARFFDPSAPVLPERPRGLVATNQPDGTLRVAWRAVAGAAKYRVQRIARPEVGAARERAWDEGLVVTGTELVLREGLSPRGLYAFRVSAANAGGEGYPSAAVVARFRGARVAGVASEALWIGGFDRRDAWVQERDNDLGYAVEHGQALAGVKSADVFFDGALKEAVEDGTVALGGYRLVMYAAGKNSTEHGAVPRAMQTRLGAYVEGGGGALLVSGEEIGWDLVENGEASDVAFFEDVLGARYVNDDAEALRMLGDGPWAGLDVSLDDGSRGTYEVVYPDALAAGPGGQVLMKWPDGTGAAVLNGRVLLFGAPLETVVPAADRVRLFSYILPLLVPDLGRDDLDLDGMPDDCEERYGLDPRDAADVPQRPAKAPRGECPPAPVREHDAPDAGPGDVDAGAQPDAGPEDTGSAGDAGGCGCSGGGGGAASLAAMVGLRRRRRRAR